MVTAFRNIALRQVVEDDLPFLFRLFADPCRSHLWLAGRRVYDEAGFQQAWAAWAADVMTSKFVVESAGRPAGLAFEYDRAPEDGHTKVTTLLEEGRVGRGGGVIATALLVRWLFQTLPLRKVYVEVHGYNPAVIGMLRKVGLAEEGCLKDFRFWDGRYWDYHIFALRREAWPRVRDRLLGPGSSAPPAGARPARAEGAARKPGGVV
jgi:RimJ/RimL family protein N-acetyltransferase